jgi:hypothetical protein
VPASIPDRYSLEVRLGRDGDIEEWLATDTSLDRPVLIRSLGPESTPERRREFVRATSEAAAASHPHLARVFAVEEVAGGAYAVSEWTGGATVADRVAAQQPIDLPDFLPNASGLSGALAALHDKGAVHGGIDTSAISYSGSHAAKLGAFGRPRTGDAGGDVMALAAALETALTGSPPGGPPPSERVDGVPRAIDVVLRSAQSGQFDAAGLEKALRAAPTPRPPQPESGPTPRRLLIAAVTLVVVAVGLVAMGFFLAGGGSPVIPSPTTAAAPTAVEPTLTTSTTVLSMPGAVIVRDPVPLDPFGEGGENDHLAVNLIDDDASTEWSTERYFDPLPLLKPGVGVSVRVEGVPARLELVGLSESTSFELYWARQWSEDISVWERIAGATASPSSTVIDLPARADGFWLVWLTDLPPTGAGFYQSAIAQLRFTP